MALYLGSQKVSNTNTIGNATSVIIPREISSTGVYQLPTSSFSWNLPSNVLDLDYNVLHHAFQGCTSLTSIDLSSLAILSGDYAMYYALYGCTSLTSIDLSSLTTISGNFAMYFAFQGCTGLTSVDLSSLAILSGVYAMSGAFQNCTSLTSIDLSSLTTMSRIYAMYHAFQNCTSLTSVDLSSLTTISGDYAMNYAFQNCTSLTSLPFPALTSTSFGSNTNQFNNMLQGVTGCTVHFPSNLQSVIGSWSDVTAGFGGTNTTVLFDLPATT